MVSNLYATLWVNTRVSFFNNIVGQLSSAIPIIPTLLMLPQLMSGGLTLGGLMKSNSAFNSVTGSLAFFGKPIRDLRRGARKPTVCANSCT